MTSDVASSHLLESLYGPCGCLRYREITTPKSKVQRPIRERVLFIGTQFRENGGSDTAAAWEVEGKAAKSLQRPHKRLWTSLRDGGSQRSAKVKGAKP